MPNRDIAAWKHIVRPGADDCHYRGYLVSGARLLQYVTDCVACLSSVREGTGGLVANINGNFREEVHAMDELIVELKLERQGNTSASMPSPSPRPSNTLTTAAIPQRSSMNLSWWPMVPACWLSSPTEQQRENEC